MLFSCLLPLFCPVFFFILSCFLFLFCPVFFFLLSSLKIWLHSNGMGGTVVLFSCYLYPVFFSISCSPNFFLSSVFVFVLFFLLLQFFAVYFFVVFSVLVFFLAVFLQENLVPQQSGWVGQSSQELFSIISIRRQQEASKFG